jgi:hypothetical protein
MNKLRTMLCAHSLIVGFNVRAASHSKGMASHRHKPTLRSDLSPCLAGGTTSPKCLFACGVTNRLSRDEESRPSETEKPLSIREFGLGTGNAVCLCEQGCAYEASKLATIKSGLGRVLPEISQHALNESMNADRLLPICSGNETTISPGDLSRLS